jgi:hypothetical protein
MLTIPQREFRALRELAAFSVEYLLVGGHAVRHYGVDRSTKDVDLFVGRSPDNAFRLHAAIVNIIGHLPDFEPEALTEPKKHVRFANDGLDLDILTTMPGLEFETAFAAREVVSLDGTPIFVISRPDLLVSKRAVAEQDPQRRARELRDVEMLVV